MEMPPPNQKKELQAFLGIINYLSKFCPSIADICEVQLTSSKTEWTWNATYKKRFDMAKSIKTEDACMKFYDEIPPLYLETDVSGISFRAALPQI